VRGWEFPREYNGDGQSDNGRTAAGDRWITGGLSRYTHLMISAFFKAIDDLSDPRLRAYLWQTVLLSLATAVGLWMGLTWLLFNTELIGELPWVGGIIETAIDYLGVVAAFVLMLILLPAFMGLFASFYIEAICRAVEERHYPDIAPPREQTIVEGVKIGAKFGILLIALNILLLLFIFIPPVYFIAGWAINGFLLGREYLEMVGFRRMDQNELVAFRKSKSGTIYLAGLAIAVVATIPVVNLLLPFFGTSMMLHVFERIRPRNDNINITISVS
jgi:CysZ protein